MTAKLDETKAQALIDEIAAREKREDIAKLDAQFARKLSALEDDDKAPADMIDKLRELWPMLRAPDEVVPFSAKALIMAAMSYFVSPLDMIPDVLGKAGYLDDAMIVRLVYRRVEVARDAFAAWSQSQR
ncbi:MAG: DUF1232 domain-containing protein [Myxococcales bacterium]|nr:DUF1232 domain-containing protein [Myxococcales bacterium]